MPFDHRHLWNTAFVCEQLRARRLSEAASFGYFWALMGFDWLQFTVIATTPTPHISAWSSAGAWATLAVTVVGLFYLFLQNGGAKGVHFLPRYAALSITVGWKFVALLIVTLWLLPLAGATQSASTLGWAATLMQALINIAMFGRMGVHLSRLRRASQP